MFKILTLNNISVKGLERLPRESYEVASEIQHPDAILLRSADLHGKPIADSVRAVGRAGAGVNNIPVDDYSNRGIPVFNAPGANANAVKELVIAGMLLAARNIAPALEFVKGVSGDDHTIDKTVESGKKNFVGFELPGRTLGVIGLGAIGVKVANAARALGMNVIGFDPQITVRAAWALSADVQQAANVDDLLARSDMVSLHVPLAEQTRGLINTARLRNMKKGVVILNFSRGPIVDEQAIRDGIEEGKVHSYVCDFPSNAMKDNPRIIALPHLGASTEEAEENCAIMVADQVRDYLENGNVTNSVNFPEVVLPRSPGKVRLTVVNANVPNMLSQMSTALAKGGVNINDMINKARGKIAYNLVDVDQDLSNDTIESIRKIEGVLSVRVIK